MRSPMRFSEMTDSAASPSTWMVEGAGTAWRVARSLAEGVGVSERSGKVAMVLSSRLGCAEVDGSCSFGPVAQVREKGRMDGPFAEKMR